MSKLGAVIAGSLSLSVIGIAVYLWISIGDTAIGVAGYLAMIGGGIATLGLGVGLMALLFYSNRQGFDERAGAPPEQRQSEDREGN